MASGKRDYESGSSSSSIVVGASKQSPVSFREAYGRSGKEDDNASGVGYDPPGDGHGDTVGCGSDPPRDKSSGAEAPSTIKGIINVNVASAAPASSTAAAASLAAGASSLYSISTHGSPVDEGKESAPNDTTITKSLNSVKECISNSSFPDWKPCSGFI